MAKEEIHGLYELQNKLERIPSSIGSNPALQRAIEKSTTKFFEAWRKRWYDAEFVSGGKGQFNADGHGFAKNSGALFKSMKLTKKFSSGISRTGNKRYGYAIPYDITTSTNPKFLPIRNERKIIKAKAGGKLRFRPFRQNKLVEADQVELHARTQGMDRWMSDRYNKMMQTTLSEKWTDLGFLGTKKFIGDKFNG